MIMSRAAVWTKLLSDERKYVKPWQEMTFFESQIMSFCCTLNANHAKIYVYSKLRLCELMILMYRSRKLAPVCTWDYSLIVVVSWKLHDHKKTASSPCQLSTTVKFWSWQFLSKLPKLSCKKTKYLWIYFENCKNRKHLNASSYNISSFAREINMVTRKQSRKWSANCLVMINDINTGTTLNPPANKSQRLHPVLLTWKPGISPKGQNFRPAFRS